MVAVNPEIMKWARETAGMSIEQAAETINLDAAYGKSPAQRLREHEHGEIEPTRGQLISMSKHYRRSLLVFYLEKPPRKANFGQDFRTVSTPSESEYDPMLSALIRDIHVRFEIVKEILEEEELSPHAYVGAASLNHSIESVVDSIVQTLGFSLDEFRHSTTFSKAFDYLRSKIEDIGVFVLLVGNLGSYHTNISAEVLQGFAIADSIAPFIVINHQDTRSAWAFTALHEIAHIWLGLTGVSGVENDARSEQFCNEVAAQILLPNAQLKTLENFISGDLEETNHQITGLGNKLKLSRKMIAYRLYREKFIDRSTWRSYDNFLRNEWNENQKNLASQRNGGPGFFRVTQHRLGKSLLSLVKRSLRGEDLTYARASKVLGVVPRNVEPLLRDVS